MFGHSFEVDFLLGSHRYREIVFAANMSAARELIRIKYPSCRVLRCLRVR